MLKVAQTRPAAFALALGLSALLAACGGGGGTTPSPVTAITATVADTDKTLTVGETTQASASVTTSATTTAKTVTWSTSNASVATVSSTGLVTALAVGTATITATSTADTSKKATVVVTVVAAPAATLTTARIYFGTATANATVGSATYTANNGAPYNSTTGIGWVTEASVGGTLVPQDMTGNARNRGAGTTATTDVRQQGQINMQCINQPYGNPCSSYTGAAGAFVYKVVNGKYNVTVSVGDAAGDPSKTDKTPGGNNQDNQNSVHVINVNGTNVVPAFTQTGTTNATNFSVKTATITVATGALVIDAKTGQNTKINYVDIVPAP